MLILFVVLIAAPLVVRNMGMAQKLTNSISNTGGMQLVQPINQDNNDTTSIYTGNNLPGGMSAPAQATGASASSTGGSAKMMFMF